MFLLRVADQRIQSHPPFPFCVKDEK
jgi:hypothetical protein